MAKYTMATIDRQSKGTSMTIAVPDAATTIQLQALVDAVADVILGAQPSGVKTTAVVVDLGDATPPASKLADRNNKWLFRVQDSTTGEIYTHEIGTADNTLLPSADSDYLDLTANQGLALKQAFDAVYQSPRGYSGVLLSVQQVNRGG